MNTISISILTSNTLFINKVKMTGMPMISNSSFMYTVVIPVCLETRACDLLYAFAKETKATVSMYIFYQDPGTGETSDGWMMFIKGDVVSKSKEAKNEEIRIRILAIRCWNYGILPPEKDKPAVLDYITSHPETFMVRKIEEK